MISVKYHVSVESILKNAIATEATKQYFFIFFIVITFIFFFYCLEKKVIKKMQLKQLYFRIATKKTKKSLFFFQKSFYNIHTHNPIQKTTIKKLGFRREHENKKKHKGDCDKAKIAFYPFVVDNKGHFGDSATTVLNARFREVTKTYAKNLITNAKH